MNSPPKVFTARWIKWVAATAFFNGCASGPPPAATPNSTNSSPHAVFQCPNVAPEPGCADITEEATRQILSAALTELKARPTASSSISQVRSPTVKDFILAKEIRANIRTKTPNIRQCYENYLSQTADTKVRKFGVRFLIQAQGAVACNTTTRDEIQNAEFKQCILNEICQLKFPKAKGSGIVIDYPFVFSTAEDTAKKEDSANDEIKSAPTPVGSPQK